MKILKILSFITQNSIGCLAKLVKFGEMKPASITPVTMWFYILAMDPKEIRYFCFSSTFFPKNPIYIFLFFFHLKFWSYDQNTKHLRHGSSEKCLAIIESKDKVVMEECNEFRESQKWRLENYDPTKL